MRLLVKAPTSMRRKRVCSGGSMPRNRPGTCRDGPVAVGMPPVERHVEHA